MLVIPFIPPVVLRELGRHALGLTYTDASLPPCLFDAGLPRGALWLEGREGGGIDRRECGRKERWKKEGREGGGMERSGKGEERENGLKDDGEEGGRM